MYLNNGMESGLLVNIGLESSIHTWRDPSTRNSYQRIFLGCSVLDTSSEIHVVHMYGKYMYYQLVAGVGINAECARERRARENFVRGCVWAFCNFPLFMSS